MRLRNLLLLTSLFVTLSAPANAAWHEARSTHFTIFADASPKFLQTFATQLEKFDKSVRILRKMDDPPPGNSGRVTIYVLPNTDAVSNLVVGKRSDIAGFYMPRASGSVAFVPKRAGTQEWEMTADTVFFHEYAHHLMLQNTDAALPPWLVEGFAEFYSTAQFERNGEVRLGTPANHRVAGLYLLDKPRMEILLGSGTANMTSGQVEAFYGWSWVLTHYLAFADDRRGQLVEYIAAIQSGVDPMRAANESFGDLKKLGQDMDRYLHVNRFKFLAVNAPGSNAISVAVRPLRPGEAAAMPARIRSARGASKKDAPAIAALIRTAATSFPNDPAVLTWLAEAEFDTGNFAAAEAAADRALALDPKIEKALIYKGRARMESMESSPNGNWTAIRDLFMKANRLDTEDAEPLSLFYETYLRAGQEPSANAIAALKYALVLAPQDPSLRMMTVRELINQKQFSEARADLAPLAFNPHSSEGRAQARKVMDALAAKDPKAALAALDNSPADDGGGD